MLTKVHPQRKCPRICSILGIIIYSIFWLRFIYFILAALGSVGYTNYLELIIAASFAIIELTHIIICLVTLSQSYYFWQKIKIYFYIIMAIFSALFIIGFGYLASEYYRLSLMEPDESRSFGLGISILLILYLILEFIFFSLPTISLLFIYKNEPKGAQGYYSIGSDKLI